MSATALLSATVCQTGLELLQATRFYTSPPGLSFLPNLDSLLAEVHPRATELSAFNRGDVIELQGPPCSGKTELCLYWAMIAALPSRWTVELAQEASTRPPRREVIDVGGREKAVVIMDADGRFPLRKLEERIRAHLLANIEDHTIRVPQLFGCKPSEEHFEAAMRKILGRIHVFKPTSGLSLAATLQGLPRYLGERSADIELSYLIVDSLSAFHHQDAYRQQQPGASSSAHSLRIALHALAHIRKTFSPVIVLTNWALSSSNKGLFRQHLATPYPAPFMEDAPAEKAFDVHDPLASTSVGPLPVNVHITLHLPSLTPFPAGTDLQDMLTGELGRIREHKRVNEVVIGVVRLPGVVQGANEAGRVAFRLTEHGVDFSNV